MPEAVLTKQLIDPANILQEAGIKQGEIVADFGCGSVGHFVFPAGRMVGPEGKVYAVDIQKGVLSSIESRIRLENQNNVQPLWGDIERQGGVRVPDQTFHLVLLINNLFLVKAFDALAEEVRRTTKIGGRLVVIDWSQTATPLGPPVIERVTPDKAKDLFTKHGFTLEREFVPGSFHWGLVFTRVS